MPDVRQLLERQAAWQRGPEVAWPEKIRMAEAIRESVLELVRTRPDATKDATTPRQTR